MPVYLWKWRFRFRWSESSNKLVMILIVGLWGYHAWVEVDEACLSGYFLYTLIRFHDKRNAYFSHCAFISLHYVYIHIYDIRICILYVYCIRYMYIHILIHHVDQLSVWHYKPGAIAWVTAWGDFLSTLCPFPRWRGDVEDGRAAIETIWGDGAEKDDVYYIYLCILYETKLRSFEVSRETMNFDCPSPFRLSRIVKTLPFTWSHWRRPCFMLVAIKGIVA